MKQIKKSLFPQARQPPERMMEKDGREIEDDIISLPSFFVSGNYNLERFALFGPIGFGL